MSVFRTAALAAALLLAAGAALADRPDHAGKGKGKGGGKAGHDREPSVTVSIGFGGEARAIVRDYYAAHGCPPGLAKKNNGCLPPGQAKKLWAVGRPLPRDVIFHDLPADLVVRIGLPPEGYKYVRVAADILMIAVGTGLVVDAIEDLGRL